MSSPKDYKPRLKAKPRSAQFANMPLKPAFLVFSGLLLAFAITAHLSADPVEATVSNLHVAKRTALDLPLPSPRLRESAEPTELAEKHNDLTNESNTSVTIPKKEKPLEIKQHIVKRGENLSIIFAKLNLSKKELHAITHSGKMGREFRSLQPGKKLSVELSEKGHIARLVYEKTHTDSIIATRTNDGFGVAKTSKKIDRHPVFASASIQSSLFNDAKSVGVSDKTIMELANIFGWDIDFALGLREGDIFSILYEKQFIDGKEIGDGAILAAEFTNRGKTFRAVRFVNKKGHSDYFTPNGNSMRKTFLRSPIDFARISSRFNLKRKHPVLNRIRAHKGVDYAASTGTPIKATGNGKILFRGWKGGYGRVVIVQHGQRYTTLYAHLSKFHGKRKKGSRVKQGQPIGYVGKSGLATGPHLHYEFRVNGVHRNPLTVPLPHAKPIPRQYLAEFNRQTQPLISRLEQTKQVRLAQAASSSSIP